MIVAAGLSPAWQQILLLDGFQVGEVNRAAEAHWCASGKVLNAGIALHHLGGPCVTVALLGGAAGEAIDRELAAMGLARVWVWSASRTRVCTTVLDRKSRATTELVENAGAVREEELERFRAAYAEAARGARFAVLSGSLPAGTPAGFYRELLERTPGRAVLDARGQELLEALTRRPFAVKPNREELGKTFGRDLAAEGALLAAMEEVERLGASWVIVSEGRKALWARGGGRTYRFRPAVVATVNPIGCGDCLAAGFAWACDRGLDPVDAIRFGMAAAAENAAMLLPSRLDLEKVKRRMEEVAVEPLGR